MIRLVCRENFLEYAGDGFIQCGRHVICPKKKNNKVLGLDCISYIDGLPEGYELTVVEKDDSMENGITIVEVPISVDNNKPITIDNRKSIVIENEKTVG